MMPLFAVVLPVIILFCGLSLDVGMIELKKLQMQSAADAAALGAVLEAERGTGNWPAQAKADASINGFTDGSNNVTITISQLPTSGAYAGRYDALQATITQTVNTIFMGALNGGKITISAQAVGLLTPCTYFVGTGTLQTYSLFGATGSLTSPSCPAYINTRMALQSSATLFGTSINVAGSAASSSVAGYAFPTNYNAQTLSDPLAATTSPSFSGACDHIAYTALLGIVTLSPGTYCGGITLTNSIATLSPGLYIITGGATWTASTVTGSGVTLFFTKGGIFNYGQFKIQGFSTVNLSAPNDATSGGIPAVVVFADRNWVHTAAQDFILSQSTIQGDGIWYLKNAGFYLYSCGTFTGTHYMGMVADNAYYSGTYFTPNNNYSYVTTGNPFHTHSYLVQ